MGFKKKEKNLISDNKVATIHYFGGELTKKYEKIPDKMNHLHNLFTNIKENFINNNQKVSKVVYCLWTGNNPLTKNRKECLHLIKKNVGVKVIIITPKNIKKFIKPNYPIHKAYYYLSEVHKSDYLRTYLMHHYGGGYTDIKRIYTNWNKFFDNLNNSNKFANGSREHSAGCASYNKEVCDNYNSLYQNGAYIFKPNTDFTKKWINLLHKKLDEKYELLKKYPASCPREINGMKLENNTISKYPLEWAEILGSIFHDICYEYKDKLLYQLPPINTTNYL